MNFKRWWAFAVAVCMIAGLAAPFSAAAASGVNGYGNKIIYLPQQLIAGGEQLKLIDYNQSALTATDDMSAAEQRTYLTNNGYNLNKFGTLKSKYASYVVASDPFDGYIVTNNGREDYNAHYSFDALSTGSDNTNIKNMIIKGDISYAFAYRTYAGYYDKDFLFTTVDKSSTAYIDANGRTKFVDAAPAGHGIWEYENISKSSGKLLLTEDSWNQYKSRDGLYIKFYGQSRKYRDEKVINVHLNDGIVIGKDTAGPSVLSVDVQKSIPENDSDHQYDASGTKKRDWSRDSSIIKDDIGDTVYISVQFDEPVRFNDSFVSDGNLEDLELEIQTIGRDGSTATPASAKFLKYAPDKNTGAPSMIFEYQIQNPDDAQAVRKDKYCTFDSVIISKNNNKTLFENITDMLDNAFGAKNGVQSDSGVTVKASAPVVDLEPLNIESVEVKRSG